ncbi:PKD domain-containing protein [candidate division KSB1 bacterium]|nr:PKD domain-containing protein [candidate division KSB1 bacterium]
MPILLVSCRFCFAQFDVSPGDNVMVENNSVRVPIFLTNPDGVEIDAFGARFLYPTELLKYSRVIKEGSLTEEWIQVSGHEQWAGIVTIGGYNLSAITDSGILLFVELDILNDASGNAVLALTDFVDDIAAAQTTPKLVVIAIPPVADFTALTQYGDLPLRVQFENLSTGTIDSYLWDFGEGGKSTQKDPLYHYTKNGPFTVTLIVSGPAGSDTTSKIDYIKASVDGAKRLSPDSFELYQNFPNPFNPGTQISFTVAQKRNILLQVFNAGGQYVATIQNGVLDAGRYCRIWNGTDDKGGMVPSGIYFCRFDAGGQTKIIKMTLMH